MQWTQWTYATMLRQSFVGFFCSIRQLGSATSNNPEKPSTKATVSPPVPCLLRYCSPSGSFNAEARGETQLRYKG